MLGKKNRESQVMDEPGEGGEDLFCSDRVECRCRLVQHEYSRVRGQDAADRHALLLAPRQRSQGPLAHIG
jgi:hypothetical protein